MIRSVLASLLVVSTALLPTTLTAQGLVARSRPAQDPAAAETKAELGKEVVELRKQVAELRAAVERLKSRAAATAAAPTNKAEKTQELPAGEAEVRGSVERARKQVEAEVAKANEQVQREVAKANEQVQREIAKAQQQIDRDMAMAREEQAKAATAHAKARSAERAQEEMRATLEKRLAHLEEAKAEIFGTKVSGRTRDESDGTSSDGASKVEESPIRGRVVEGRKPIEVRALDANPHGVRRPESAPTVVSLDDVTPSVARVIERRIGLPVELRRIETAEGFEVLIETNDGEEPRGERMERRLAEIAEERSANHAHRDNVHVVEHQGGDGQIEVHIVTDDHDGDEDDGNCCDCDCPMCGRGKATMPQPQKSRARMLAPELRIQGGNGPAMQHLDMLRQVIREEVRRALQESGTTRNDPRRKPVSRVFAVPMPPMPSMPPMPPMPPMPGMPVTSEMVETSIPVDDAPPAPKAPKAPRAPRAPKAGKAPKAPVAPTEERRHG